MAEEHGFPELSSTEMIGSTYAHAIQMQAMLMVTLENQALILAHLTNQDEDEVRKDVWVRYDQAVDIIRKGMLEQQIKNQIKGEE